MTRISFLPEEIAILQQRMQRPILSYSLDRALLDPPYSAPPHSIMLWGDDDRALKIYSDMHDLSEREEIGRLRFDIAKSNNSDYSLTSIPEEYRYVVCVNKLVVQVRNFFIESGISIATKSSRKITIAPSEIPLCIAIESDFIEEIFETEFDQKFYIEEPLF